MKTRRQRPEASGRLCPAVLESALDVALFQADWDANVAAQWLRQRAHASCPVFAGSALLHAIAALAAAKSALGSAERFAALILQRKDRR